MSEQLTEYECIDPVRHNSKRHEPGAPIHLSDKDAAPLLTCGAICEPEPVAEPVVNSLTDEEQILAAIPGLLGDKTNLTTAGIPKTDALSDAVGFDVSAKMRDTAWTQYNTAQTGDAE